MDMPVYRTIPMVIVNCLKLLIVIRIYNAFLFMTVLRTYFHPFNVSNQ